MTQRYSESHFQQHILIWNWNKASISSSTFRLKRKKKSICKYFQLMLRGWSSRSWPITKRCYKTLTEVFTIFAKHEIFHIQMKEINGDKSLLPMNASWCTRPRITHFEMVSRKRLPVFWLKILAFFSEWCKFLHSHVTEDTVSFHHSCCMTQKHRQ